MARAPNAFTSRHLNKMNNNKTMTRGCLYVSSRNSLTGILDSFVKWGIPKPNVMRARFRLKSWGWYSNMLTEPRDTITTRPFYHRNLPFISFPTTYSHKVLSSITKYSTSWRRHGNLYKKNSLTWNRKPGSVGSKSFFHSFFAMYNKAETIIPFLYVITLLEKLRSNVVVK